MVSDVFNANVFFEQLLCIPGTETLEEGAVCISPEEHHILSGLQR